MNAARDESLMPPLERDAAIGMVPYMHSGEAMPSSEERTIDVMLSVCLPTLSIAPSILAFMNTDMTEPTAIPERYQPRICLSWISK